MKYATNIVWDIDAVKAFVDFIEIIDKKHQAKVLNIEYQKYKLMSNSEKLDVFLENVNNGNLQIIGTVYRLPTEIKIPDDLITEKEIDEYVRSIKTRKIISYDIKTVTQNFLKDWQPIHNDIDITSREVMQIFNKWLHRINYKYNSFDNLETIFGFPYTSSSSFAGIWNTNAEMVYKSHYFDGLALDDKLNVMAVFDDEYINIGNLNDKYIRQLETMYNKLDEFQESYTPQFNEKIMFNIGETMGAISNLLDTIGKEIENGTND